jgi:hypothetical protein
MQKLNITMETKSNEYVIYVFTNWGGITYIIAGLIADVFIMLLAKPEISIPFFLLIFLFLNAFGWYLSRTFLLQSIKIVWTNERIYLNYLNLKLSKTKKSISAPLEEISRFSDYSNGIYLKFELYFSQGQTFTHTKVVSGTKKMTLNSY